MNFAEGGKLSPLHNDTIFLNVGLFFLAQFYMVLEFYIHEFIMVKLSERIGDGINIYFQFMIDIFNDTVFKKIYIFL